MAIDLQAWSAIGGFAFGAVAGSFLALLYVRLPNARPVVAGRSRCDACARVLTPLELVPLLSYPLLGGRCRGCGTPIPPSLWVMEIAAGLVGAVAVVAASTPPSLLWALFGWTLLLLAALDLRHYWLPVRGTLFLAIAGIAAVLLTGGDVFASLIGGVAGFAVLEAIRRGYRRLRGRDGMGGGDPLLLGAIGVWTGWQALPLVMVGASLAGLALVLVRAACGERIDSKTRVPLGACFAAAALALWVAAAFFGVINLAAL